MIDAEKQEPNALWSALKEEWWKWDQKLEASSETQILHTEAGGWHGRVSFNGQTHYYYKSLSRYVE